MVFGALLRGAQPHLARLERDRPGAYVNLQRRLEDVMSRIGDWPTTPRAPRPGAVLARVLPPARPRPRRSHQPPRCSRQRRSTERRRSEGVNAMTTAAPTTITTDVERRHDFVLLFDVRDGNPNGDPGRRQPATRRPRDHAGPRDRCRDSSARSATTSTWPMGTKGASRSTSSTASSSPTGASASSTSARTATARPLRATRSSGCARSSSTCACSAP